MCNVGYELFNKNGTAGFSIDKAESGDKDGDTFQYNKTCVPVMCPPLQAPENGIILTTQDSFHFGDLVSFQCHFGFVMAGSASLLCTSGGVWNGSVPECQCEYTSYNNIVKIKKLYQSYLLVVEFWISHISSFTFPTNKRLRLITYAHYTTK